MGAGGAFLQSGVLVELGRTSFVGNRATDAGLAVQSLGIAQNITTTIFESNTYYCPSGEFGYEIGEFEEEVTNLPCSRLACLYADIILPVYLKTVQDSGRPRGPHGHAT